MQGGGQGQGRGGGSGRMGGRGAGLGGTCICPSCGKRVPHRQGTPCNKISCPQCGQKMTRE